MVSPTMKEAFEEIQRLSEDSAMRRIAEYRDFELRGQQQREIDREKAGMARGLEVGKWVEKIETVKRLYKLSLTVEQTAEATSLDSTIVERSIKE